jgi:hypothetical protein
MLVFFIGLYAASFLLQIISPFTNIQQAVVVTCLRLGVIVLTLLFITVYAIKNPHEPRAWLTAMLIVLALYIGSLFTPLIAPYGRYPLYVVKCRGLPVIAKSFSDSYTVPSDTKFYKVSVFTDHYFCTEQEAKAAYFHKYPEAP